MGKDFSSTLPSRMKDLTGQRFGRLVVIEFSGVHINPSGTRDSRWLCKCNCGAVSTIRKVNLSKGDTRSCGCLYRETRKGGFKHGLSKSPEYIVWFHMIQRCHNENNMAFHNYGARGIKVCDLWHKFENFYANMGPRPSSKHTIERINNNTGYSPDNCLWADRKTQSRNTRRNVLISHNGQTKPLIDWVDILGIKHETLRCRLKRYGWTVERALTEPVRPMKKSSAKCSRNTPQ